MHHCPKKASWNIHLSVCSMARWFCKLLGTLVPYCQITVSVCFCGTQAFLKAHSIFLLATPMACRSSWARNWTHTTAVNQATARTMPVLNLLDHQGTPKGIFLSVIKNLSTHALYRFIYLLKHSIHILNYFLFDNILPFVLTKISNVSEIIDI